MNENFNTAFQPQNMLVKILERNLTTNDTFLKGYPIYFLGLDLNHHPLP